MLISSPSQLILSRASAHGCKVLVIVDYLMLSMQVRNLFLCNQDQMKSSLSRRCLNKTVCSRSTLYLAGGCDDLPTSLVLPCV